MKKCFVIISIVMILFAACGKNEHSGSETISDTLVQEEQTTSQIVTPTAAEPEFAVNFNEKTNTYKFAYKKSVLNISREKFDEYNLTNENIQKFFDEMEKVYVLFADFFLVHNLPGVFTYNTVTQEVADTTVGSNAWARQAENATYYEENMFAEYLSRIDTGFPSIVGHEVGHLYTAWGKESGYNASKYTWDLEMFAEFAVHYLISLPDMNVINVIGEVCLTYPEDYKRMAEMPGYEEMVKAIPSLSLDAYPRFMYYKIFTVIEKYGYNTLHEVLKEMTGREVEYNIKSYFDLFCDVYAEKTGENLKDEFTREELDEIYREISVR